MQRQVLIPSSDIDNVRDLPDKTQTEFDDTHCDESDNAHNFAMSPVGVAMANTGSVRKCSEDQSAQAWKKAKTYSAEFTTVLKTEMLQQSLVDQLARPDKALKKAKTY